MMKRSEKWKRNRLISSRITPLSVIFFVLIVMNIISVVVIFENVGDVSAVASSAFRGKAAFFAENMVTGWMVGILPVEEVNLSGEEELDQLDNQSQDEWTQDSIDDEISIQADCGGESACSCGDTLTSSWTMSSDLTGCDDGLIIGGNDITLDCQGHTILGTWGGSSDGVAASSRSGITIKNCNISRFIDGIYLTGTTGSTILNNTLNNTYGIRLMSSSNNNLIINNTFNGNRYGFYLNSDNNNLTNNTFTLFDINFISSSAENNIISNNYFSHSTADGEGLYIGSEYNNVTHNTFYDCYRGIYLGSSGDNTLIFNNTIIDGSYGIDFFSSGAANNNISFNTISNNSLLDLDMYIAGCNQYIHGNNGTGERAIGFYNSTVTLMDLTFSQLILCDADGSNLTNITISGDVNVQNNYLFVKDTSYSNFTNINSSNNYYGIYLRDSDNNNFTYTYTDNNTEDGIYATSSDSNKFTNAMSRFNGDDGYTLSSSSNNVIYNVTARNNSHTGLYITGSGNNISHSTFVNNANGTYDYSANNISLCDIYNNTEYNLDGNGSAQFNWWGTTDCIAIIGNITGGASYEPFLDGSFVSGSTSICPNQYCGMNITSDINMNASINCSSDGVIISGNGVTLNCNGFSVRGTNLNDTMGIYPQSGINLTIKNCLVDGFEYGIFLSRGTDNTVENVTIRNVTTGVYFYLSGNSSLINSTLDNSFSSYSSTEGVQVLRTTHNVLVRNNSISNFDIGINARGKDSTFSDNYLWNNAIGYEFRKEYSYQSSRVNSTFTNERIVNHSSGIQTGPSVDYDIGDISFIDCYFADNTYDLNLTGNGDSNITFINGSINKTKVYSSGARAYFKWYVDVNVTDSEENALESATAVAYDSLGGVEDSETTDSQGLARLTVTEYYRQTGINYYLTPGNIVAKKNNYTQNSTSVNLYNETYALINLSMAAFSCGSTLNGDADLGNNFLCENSGLNISADDITIDGQWYNLSGNGSGTGIELSGRNKVQINNLRIFNFTRGIDLTNVNNSGFTNLRIINTSRGIVFNNSNNNTVYNSVLGNNSEFSILAVNEGGTETHLVNASININNISVSGTAQVYLKWYVDVNATYFDADGNYAALANANVSSYFSDTGLLDHSTSTSSNGIARLALTELKKNATGTYYLTPHSINLSFTTSSGTYSNYTTINLSKTNNTQVNLNLTLDCTSPSGTMTLTSNTTFCPGTYSFSRVNIEADDVTLTCDNTILNVYAWIDIDGIDNFRIEGCGINSNDYAITGSGASNITIINNSIGGSVYASLGSSYTIINNTFNPEEGYGDPAGVYFWATTHSDISKNIFLSETGIRLKYLARHNTINNNTFSGLRRGVSIEWTSYNNSIYHNNFSSVTEYNIYNLNYTSAVYENYFNISSGDYAQGNEYSDYCDNGTDLNDDSYADNVSSATVNDWPYSANVSSKVYDSIANNGGVIDYGPKIITCPAAEVFLTSSSTSASSSTSEAGQSAAAEAAVGEAAAATVSAPSAADSSVPSGKMGAEDTKSFIKSEVKGIKTGAEGTVEVILSVSNTGDKDMILDPDVVDDPDDPYFIITRKTTAGESFTRLSGISYSSNAPLGNLLRAQLEAGAEQFVVPPGESKDITLKIKPPALSLEPRKLKVVLKTFDEVVNENGVEVGKRSLTGSALDLVQKDDTFDLYLVVSPSKEAAANSEKTVDNSLTGAAVATPQQNFDEYTFEVAINRKGEPGMENVLPMKFSVVQHLWNFIKKQTSRFADVYGPYQIKKGEGFIFAQQMNYDPAVYQGEHVIKTRLMKEGSVIVENEFEVDFE